MAQHDVVIGLVGGAILVVAMFGVFLREGTPPAPQPPALGGSGSDGAFSLHACRGAALAIPVDRAAAQALVPKPLVVSSAAASPFGAGSALPQDRALLLVEAYACGNSSLAEASVAVDTPSGNLSSPRSGESYFYTFAFQADGAAWSALSGRANVTRANISVELGTQGPAGTLSASVAGPLGFTANGQGPPMGPLAFPPTLRQFFSGPQGLRWFDANQTATTAFTGQGTVTLRGGDAERLAGSGAQDAAAIGIASYDFDARFS